MKNQANWAKLENGAAGNYDLRCYCRAIGWKGDSKREQNAINYFLPSGLHVAQIALNPETDETAIYVLKKVNGMPVIFG